MNYEALTFFMKNAKIKGRTMGWISLLQESDYEVITKPEKVHVLVDHLSTIPWNEDEEINDPYLRDASLFLVETRILWYKNVPNLLATQQFPLGYSKRQ